MTTVGARRRVTKRNKHEVEALKGRELYVTRENAIKLDKNEYFVADLIGLDVVDEDKDIRGRLTDVMPTGANDVYVIGLEDGGELLLPAIKQCILDVDVEAGFMKVHVLEGLI